MKGRGCRLERYPDYAAMKVQASGKMFTMCFTFAVDKGITVEASPID